MKLGSLFAGVGGLDIAFTRAGFDVSFQVELDAKCRQTLNHHFPSVEQFTDIKEVSVDNLPHADILVGGFPCQDISVAGRRAGLDGARSGLWWEYHRLISEVRPAWFVIENVAGLLSSGKPKGADLGAILGAVGELGYGFAYRVLDAQGFGVPQRRRRVVIVGCLGDARGPAEVLLEPESGGGDLATGRAKGTGVAALTARGVGTCGADANEGQAGHLIASTIRTKEGASAYRGDGTDNIIPALTTRCGNTQDDQQTGQLVTGFAWQAGGDGTSSGAFLDDTCPTLQKSQTMAVSSSLGVRRLTPLECERLQGFPDNHTAMHSDATRYRQMGNAVAVPVFEWVARRIAKYAGGS